MEVWIKIDIMKGKLIFLLKYYLFWIAASVLSKLIFLIYQWKDSRLLTGSDYWHILAGGLKLDLSFGGYVILLSSVVLALSVVLPCRAVRFIFSVLTFVVLVFFFGVVTVDLELFRNWGYHLDATPLMYLKTPKEALASTPVGLTLGLLAGMALLIAGAYRIFRLWVLPSLREEKRTCWSIPVFLLIGGAMILPIRGGINLAPLNSSFVFFHPKSMYANQAAVNPVWNFLYELMHLDKLQRQFVYMPDEKAQQVVDRMMVTGEAYPRVLKTERPNIVFLLLESFTANAIEVLGGEPGATPSLNALAKEGILFSNIYATSSRSDRGMVAAISALPSHPSVAVIKYPSKMMAHPRFPKDLEAAGYATRYYYAGDINFGGFRSYVTMSFQDMVTEDDFAGEAVQNRFKWGVHDQYMFDRLFEDVKQAPQPFLYMAFNMSSHEPFSVPGKVAFPGDDVEHKFLNAIHYSDSCIGRFIDRCKASGLWDNTLFVLMADHGTRHIGHKAPEEPAAYHIPLILTGGVLNVRDTVITKIGSQTDMIATVLAQLGLDHSSYPFSRNLLADIPHPFACYSYPNAAGIVSEDGVSIMDLQSGRLMEGGELEQNTLLLKAYLQLINRETNRH